MGGAVLFQGRGGVGIGTDSEFGAFLSKDLGGDGRGNAGEANGFPGRMNAVN